MTNMFNPWRAAREVDVAIEFVPNLRPRGTYAAGLIQIREGLSQCERRVVLAHELEHFRHGDDGVSCSRWHLDKHERQVHLSAARLLISIEDLAQAVISEPDYPSMAEELWVDQYTLRLRLAHITEAEKAQIRHLCPPEWSVA